MKPPCRSSIANNVLCLLLLSFTFPLLLRGIEINGTLKDYGPSDRFGGSLQLPADGELFEGDIMMDKRFRDVIMSGESKKSSLKVP